MTKVQIRVELEIDDRNEEIDVILSEMDYSFSCVDEENHQLILRTEILERIN